MLLISHYYATRSAAQGVKQLVRVLKFLYQVSTVSAGLHGDMQGSMGTCRAPWGHAGSGHDDPEVVHREQELVPNSVRLQQVEKKGSQKEAREQQR